MKHLKITTSQSYGKCTKHIWFVKPEDIKTLADGFFIDKSLRKYVDDSSIALLLSKIRNGASKEKLEKIADMYNNFRGEDYHELSIVTDGILIYDREDDGLQIHVRYLFFLLDTAHNTHNVDELLLEDLHYWAGGGEEE